jgi:hypothetical protein
VNSLVSSGGHDVKGVPSIAVYNTSNIKNINILVEKSAKFFDRPEILKIIKYVQNLNEKYTELFIKSRKKTFDKIEKIVVMAPLLLFIKGSQDKPE